MGILDRFRKKNKQPPQGAAQSAGPKADSVSPGGSPIYRYQEQDHGLRAPKAYGTYAQEVEEYFEQCFSDRESFVYHELVSDLVHVDVHILRPTEDAPFYVLYTTGMSDLPMTLPQEISDREDLKYAELYLFLPGNWDLGKEGQLGENLPYEQFWPIQMLKFFARFPHEYQTWLGFGHTIPNGPDYAPLCNGVGFGGVVLSAFSHIEPVKTKDGKEINLYLMIPAYKQEIEYKLKYGMEGLEKRFAEGKLPLVLDIHRSNLCEDFTEILDG